MSGGPLQRISDAPSHASVGTTGALLLKLGDSRPGFVGIFEDNAWVTLWCDNSTTEVYTEVPLTGARTDDYSEELKIPGNRESKLPLETLS